MTAPRDDDRGLPGVRHDDDRGRKDRRARVVGGAQLVPRHHAALIFGLAVEQSTP